MNREPALTLAFLAHAPDAAARVLDGLEPADAAALFAEAPARLCAPVLQRMHTWTGARCLEQLGPDASAAILQRLPLHDAVALLRLLPADSRRPPLDALPARVALRLRRALGYPAGSVGAWVDPDVPSFPVTASAGDALRYLRDSDGVSHVFVHAESGDRYLGAVSIGQLLRMPRETALGDAGVTAVRALSSRASLATALAHPGWDEFLVLPVVARNRTLVGGLKRGSLSTGLAERRAGQRARPASVPVQLLAALGIAWSGLTRLMFDALADDRTA